MLEQVGLARIVGPQHPVLRFVVPSTIGVDLRRFEHGLLCVRALEPPQRELFVLNGALGAAEVQEAHIRVATLQPPRRRRAVVRRCLLRGTAVGRDWSGIAGDKHITELAVGVRLIGCVDRATQPVGGGLHVLGHALALLQQQRIVVHGQAQPALGGSSRPVRRLRLAGQVFCDLLPGFLAALSDPPRPLHPEALRAV
eukprot:966015-Prymnesium_polylepis.2